MHDPERSHSSAQKSVTAPKSTCPVVSIRVINDGATKTNMGGTWRRRRRKTMVKKINQSNPSNGPDCSTGGARGLALLRINNGEKNNQSNRSSDRLTNGMALATNTWVVVPLEMRKIKYDIAKLDIKVYYLQYKRNTLFSCWTSLVNRHRALVAHFFI